MISNLTLAINKWVMPKYSILHNFHIQKIPKTSWCSAIVLVTYKTDFSFEILNGDSTTNQYICKKKEEFLSITRETEHIFKSLGSPDEGGICTWTFPDKNTRYLVEFWRDDTMFVSQLNEVQIII